MLKAAIYIDGLASKTAAISDVNSLRPSDAYMRQ